ncbi:hypothetical protein HRS9139_10399 [Pyrenophora teres f. teres]|uniref:Transposon-encoded protein with TYA n=1 Tax=Pyrenophora teres f. teres TaxID=97479 RepID=A0A6S6WB07_9PLEO|nr:hypothetical protein HRS9139_10399 [Pyrenophora teres f. teres]CAE7205183.1 Transposon-encoded protein with TYA [Pyrenophora teres f. teres]
MAPQLKRGDKVYLRTKNLRTKRPSKGLDNVKVGPFLILDRKGPVTYTLNLPPDARIHPRFHKTFYYETEEENEFEVEKIVAHRVVDNGTEYLVKWLGYPNSENTWEPDTNLTNCRQLLLRSLSRHLGISQGNGLVKMLKRFKTLEILCLLTTRVEHLLFPTFEQTLLLAQTLQLRTSNTHPL